MSISNDLYTRLQSTLLRCGPFHSDRELRAMFADARISLWRNQLPETDTPTGRVRTIIDLLRDKRSAAQENGLVLLLQVLADQTAPDDACHRDLATLAEALESGIAASGVVELPDTGVLARDAYRTIYHNLPQPDYGRFIGREEELAKVARILRPYPHSQYALVTIDGIGGIGKSTLALEIAHRYLRSYEKIPPEERFDAIIWVSAKKNTLTTEGIKPRHQVLHTLDDIYTTISIVLRREDITRARAEEQFEVTRNALTCQRSLLIVDNMETVDDEGVMAFLHELPAPTKAIVTTRHRIDMAYPVRLVGMPETDAIKLILQECGKQSVRLSIENTNRLYARTGGVPLAIVWSIAQMGSGYEAERVLFYLGNPKSDIARFCFEGVVARIRNRISYKLLIAIALYPIMVTREALGYVTELAELDRDEGLVELERLSLVNRTSGRFDMLPLVRDYVYSDIEIFYKAKTVENIVRAWERWLREQIECDDFYWTWLGSPRIQEYGETILAILQRGISQSRWRDIEEFIKPALFHLQVTGRRAEGLKLANICYEAIESIGNVILTAWIELYIGWVLTQNDDERAEDMLKSALHRFEVHNELKGKCLALCFTGQMCRKFNVSCNAKSLLEEALSLAEKNCFTEGQVLVLYEFGKLARDEDEWEKSYQFLEQVVDIISSDKERYGDEMFLALLGNIGQIAIRLGKFNKAEQYCLASFSRLRGPDRVTSFAARLNLCLAEARLRLGNIDSAKQYAVQALDIANTLSNDNLASKAKNLLSETL